MPAHNGFELQDTDIALLHYVFQLRIATVDHLAALSGRSVRALWGRLLKLKERRYLASVARLTQKHVYSIGSQALPLLIEHGFAPTDLAEKRLRHNELTEIGIRHSLFVADIHANLLLHTRNGAVNLAQWTEGQSLWDTAPGLDGESIPIRPDAYFILKQVKLPEMKNALHIFLEADRSTMAHTRMAAKINGYVTYHGQRRHTKKYPGMQSFVVATVTQTRSRAEELRNDLHPLIPRAAREAYPFIPFEDLTLTSLVPHAASAPLL
jgi:Replication-relaxation